MSRPRPCAAFHILGLLGALAIAPKASALPPAATPPVQEREGPWRHLDYRELGPATGGRATQAIGVPGDPRTCYLATAAGGVWASRDGGLHWEPIFDDQPVSSIGSIAVAESDPNVLYVGTGEAYIRGNVAEGDGLYRSTDAGASFEKVWSAEGQIAALAIHPRDADVVFAAALGSPFGPGPDRGLLRSTDGGESFETVLFVDQDTGACDVCLDPGNPRIVYAATWQARRTPWDMTSGGPGSGLYRSKDGGESFERLDDSVGLPEGEWGRVGVRVAPSDSRRVYALIEAEEGGLYRSDDGGEEWRRVNDHRAIRQRAWYYSQLTVDPRDANVVWFPQVWSMKTVDGGEHLRSVEVGGWDHHQIWIDPEDPLRMLCASDAGVALTFDGGEHWHRPALPLAQLYHLSTDTRTPYTVMASVQDLGTVSAPGDTLRGGGVQRSDWRPVGGGEAGWVAPVPGDPDVVYAGEYLGYLSRFDARTGRSAHVGLYPDNSSGIGAGQLPYRFQWTAPILASQHDPSVVYHAGNVLMRSADRGQTWTVISPDLTRDDDDKQEWAGGPITGDNTGVEYYCTIFALAESAHDSEVLWTGSDDGLVYLTRDGGEQWAEITPPSLPEWATVTCIEPCPFEDGAAYVVANAHRLDDESPYVWKTDDFGATWRSLSRPLDPEIALHVLREDRQVPGLLYLGTERGVLVSRDDGVEWSDLSLNLPTVAVVDLALAEDDLVVGTLGRGIHVFDDLGPIRETTASVLTRPVHLYPIAATIGWHRGPASHGSDEGAADNPPDGVVFHYFLGEADENEVVAEILDADGTVIRRLSSLPEPSPYEEGDLEADPDPPEAVLSAESGIHRAVWDLRHQGADRIPGAKIDIGSPETGPRALPGDYVLRLGARGLELEQEFRVEADPREEYDADARLAQNRFHVEACTWMSRITAAVIEIRALREQLEDRAARLEDREEAAELVEDCTALVQALSEVEELLHNPNAEVSYDILAGRHGGSKLYSRWSWLYSTSDEHPGPPTQGMREVSRALADETEEALEQLRILRREHLARIETEARRLGLGFVLVPGDDGP